MYYASFGILAIIIHIIINFEAIRYPLNGDNIVKRRYRSFLWGIMSYYVSDVLWGFLYDTKIVPLVYADTVLYFWTLGLSLFLWMRFTVAFLNKNDIFSKILSYTGWSIFVFEIVTIIVNFFIPIMFAFESDGEYKPMQARYIALGLKFMLFVVMAVYTLIIAVKEENRRGKLHHRAMGFSGLVMSVFIVLQAIYPLLPFYAIGCLIANCIIHTYVEVDDKVLQARELGSVKKIAYKDVLTDVKNANAYTEAKAGYEEKIHDKVIKELGIVVFDLNNLKKVNDTLGHEAGDKYLKASSKLICGIFKHSPVYRIGGDEFVALLEREDYQNRENLLDEFNKIIENNMRDGGAVIAAGMDVYLPNVDFGFDEIFERADTKMYSRKKQLKNIKIIN